MLLIGGGVWRASSQGVFSTGRGPAYEPWDTWHVETEDGFLNLVRAAILAANPHNSQPWLFRITDARVDLYADTTRTLGSVDPFLRELYLGLGCALENLVLAAHANDYTPRVTLLPGSSNPAHAARIDLTAGPAQITDLYHATPNRKTNRGPYTERSVSEEILTSLRDLKGNGADVEVFWFAEEPARGQVGSLIIRATELFIEDAELARDSHYWFRDDWSEIHKQRDGITLDAQGLPLHIRVAGKMLPTPSQEQGNRQWLSGMRNMQVPTAAAFGIIAVKDARDNAQRIQAGRLWQRMHLWATTQGLAMHPLNQPNEYADHEAALGRAATFENAIQDLIGDSAWKGIFTFRTGYPTTSALASPRRAVKEVLL